MGASLDLRKHLFTIELSYGYNCGDLKSNFIAVMF